MSFREAMHAIVSPLSAPAQARFGRWQRWLRDDVIMSCD